MQSWRDSPHRQGWLGAWVGVRTPKVCVSGRLRGRCGLVTTCGMWSRELGPADKRAGERDGAACRERGGAWQRRPLPSGSRVIEFWAVGLQAKDRLLWSGGSECLLPTRRESGGVWGKPSGASWVLEEMGGNSRPATAPSPARAFSTRRLHPRGARLHSTSSRHGGMSLRAVEGTSTRYPPPPVRSQPAPSCERGQPVSCAGKDPSREPSQMGPAKVGPAPRALALASQ